MKIIAQGKLPMGEGTAHSSRTFPGFCLLPDGRMLAGFKGSPIKESLMGERDWLCFSSDGGRSWSEPYAPFPEEYEVDGRVCTFRGLYCTSLGGARVLALTSAVFHQGKDIPYFNTETEGLLDTDIYMATSDDYGRSFGPLTKMDTTPYNQPVPLTGPALRLPDGTLMCQFELNKTYLDETPWVHSSVVIFSKDNGQTWGGPVAITRDPDMYHWDQRPAVLENGRLLDLFWSFDRRKADYLNIHASESLDGGISWSPVWDTGLPGQPGAPADLGDGRIAAIAIDRSGRPTIYIKTSADGARSFDGEPFVVYQAPQALVPQETDKASMQDAWSEMGAFAVGHPGMLKLPGGNLLAYYYAGPHTNRTDICWAEIEP